MARKSLKDPAVRSRVLSSLRAGNSITKASKDAGVTRQGLRKARDRDPIFDADCAEASLGYGVVSAPPTGAVAIAQVAEPPAPRAPPPVAGPIAGPSSKWILKRLKALASPEGPGDERCQLAALALLVKCKVEPEIRAAERAAVREEDDAPTGVGFVRVALPHNSTVPQE